MSRKQAGEEAPDACGFFAKRGCKNGASCVKTQRLRTNAVKL
jgi:hypothetical protein